MEAIKHIITLVAFLMLFIISLTFISSMILKSFAVQSELEKSLMVYTLSSTANSLAGVEEGTVFNEDLKNEYDIKILCFGRRCSLKVKIPEESWTTRAFVGEQEYERELMFYTKSAYFTNTDTVCVEKSDASTYVSTDDYAIKILERCSI
ncbi:MAG: hypothetical protein ABIF08_04565 [Nanoarchaeota archaeon]